MTRLPAPRRKAAATVRGGSVTTALLAAMILAGCASPPPPAPRPLPPTPVAFKEVDGRWIDVRPAEAQPRGDWWRTFGDPQLDALVERADADNTSLQLAAARLQQARALLRSTDADRAPQVGLTAQAARQTVQPGLGVPPHTPLSAFTVGPSASYDADLFGRLALARDAAALDAQSREALTASTRLAVQSDVAQTYFALRALDEERALVRDTVAAYRDTLQLTERRYGSGDVAELDLARVQAEVASTESQLLALERQRALREHALAVLLGAPASTFSVAVDAGSPHWTAEPPRIPAGVPGAVLARRPDVAAAQAAWHAAQVRVGVARTAWFPDVSLTAGGGLASPSLGDLVQWSARSWGIGALLSLPLFEGGRREANLLNAGAEWDAAAASYRDQVLQAFREVEDQLSDLRLLADQADSQAQAVAAAGRATRLSDVRYRNGYVSQLELLDARRTELGNRREALQVHAARYAATVGLVRALGGAWDVPAGDDDGRRGAGRLVGRGGELSDRVSGPTRSWRRSASSAP